MAEAFAAVHPAQFDADDSPWGPPSEWLDDGERLTLSDRDLDVLATPGHTAGHIVLRDVASQLLFAGDHILPHITPSIGYDGVPEPLPLRSYMASLRLVREMPDALLLPAHGPVVASAHQRADELLAHHEQRFEVIRDRVERGDSTALDIASAMAWTSRGRRLHDMDVVNQSLAILETLAHLDVMALKGEVQVEIVNGVGHHSLRPVQFRPE